MKKELQNRVIEFTAEIIRLTESFKKTYEAWHLKKQIIRSSTSCALNYGEVQHAESRKDFIHKLSIVLKELRETQINLQLVEKIGLCSSTNKYDDLFSECDQLIAIFVATIITTKKNMQ